MKKRGNIVYLAGPMANIAEFNRPAFRAAEAALAKNNKYVVINPAKLPIWLHADDYMPICLQMINAADMICLLDGWEHSAGSRLEKHYAEHRGLPVYRFVDGEMIDTLE